jgi:hypothetical protein
LVGIGRYDFYIADAAALEIAFEGNVTYWYDLANVGLYFAIVFIGRFKVEIPDYGVIVVHEL